MWNSLHLGNYSTCRCASHKKHHEVKGKQLAGAFQSSSMALTDLDTLASTFRCFSLHTPQTSTSHKAHYPTTTLKLWRVATSGVFPVLFLAATSSLRLLGMSLLASGQGWKAGVERCCLECLQSSKGYSTVYVIHHCMMQTQDQQAKQMEYTA